MFYSYNIEF
jgi:structure-specific recognition protein 1